MRVWAPVLACAVALSVRVGIPQSTAQAPQPPPRTPPALTGEVASAEGGKPLKQALVEAFARYDTQTARERRAAGSILDEPVASARTDDRGRFRLEVPPGVRVVVAARAAGRAAARIDAVVTPAAGEPARDLGRVELESGRAIQGRVMGPEGPVAGARVSASMPRGGGVRRPGAFARGGSLLAAAAPPIVTTTAKDGSFTLEGLPDSLVMLRVHAPGYAPDAVRETGGTGTVTLKLSKGSPVAGRVVTPSGKPAAGAWVLAGDDGLEGAARCDAQGRFRIERVAPGARALIATGDAILIPRGRDDVAIPAESWAPSSPARLTLPLAAGAPEPVMTLRPGANVRARVVDAATRAPFEGALLALDEPGDAAPRSVMTTERGEVLFTGVPAGPVSLLGFADRYINEVEGPRPVKAGATAEITLALSQAASLEGTVRDAAGRPVSGARVSLTTGPPRPLPIPIPVNIPFGEPSLTDENGRFTLSGLPARRPFRLAVEQPGFMPWEATDIRLRPGEKRTGVDAWLDAGLMVTGRVVDKEGRAIGGASVTATRAQEGSPMGGRVMFRMGSGPGGRGRTTTFGGGDSLPETITAQDGVFRVRGARPGVWSLDVKAGGFAPKNVAGLKLDDGAKTLDAGDLVVDKGAALKGRVVDSAGAPIPFARGAARRELEIVSETVAGPDGTFALEDLVPAAPVALVFSAEGFGQKETTGLAPPVDDLTVTLPTASTLSGEVLDQESRRPVADFSVSTTRTRSAGGGGMSQMNRMVGPEESFHDEAGAFTLDDVSPGRLDVTVRAPGFRESVLRDVEVPEGKDVEGVRILLDRAASVSGVVVDDAGKPLASVSVSRSQGSSGSGGFTMRLGPGSDGPETDGDGRFLLDGLEPGPVTLAFSHPEFEPAERDVEVSGDVTGLRVAMTRGASLTGIVMRDEDGSAVASATVTAQAAGSSAFGGMLSARTGPDGTFQIDAVRPGRYMVTASATGLRTLGGAEEVVVASGSPPPPLEIRLGGGVTLNGQITGVKEQDLPKMNVMAFTPGSAGLGASAAVDATGRFEMKGLPSGTVNLRAGSNLMEGRSMVKTVQIPEGAATFETVIEFPRGRRIEGLVSRAGQPLDGATVLFTLENVRTSAGATTDTAGRYVLEDLDEGDYEVHVMHFGSGLSHSTKVSVAADKTFDIELPTRRLAGTVLDATTGKPLENATVSVDPAAGKPAGVLQFRNRSTTDAAGAFSFDGLAEGMWTVTARRDGYAVETRPVRVVPNVDPEPSVFELTRADGLVFRALDARSGMPLTRIEAMVLAAAAASDPLAGQPGSALFQGQLSADAGGTFHLDSLGPGAYTLILGGQGLATRTMRGVTVPAGETSFALEPGGQLEAAADGLTASQSARGVLLDAEGKPVHWQLFNADPSFPLNAASPTTVRDLPAGAYRLRAAMPGGSVAEKNVTIAAGGTTRVSIP